MYCDLSVVIPKIINGGCTPAELSAFIKLTQRLAFSVLQRRQFRGLRICKNKRNMNAQLRDLALDCIASLFERNERGDFILWQRYFNRHLPPNRIPSRLELLDLMQRIVSKKVNQELARLFAERRPQDARILRNLRVAASKDQNLRLFRRHGTEYISLRETPIDDRRTPISTDILMEYGAAQSARIDTSILFIRAMLDELQRHPDAQQRLPLNLLVKIISARQASNLRNHLFAKAEAESIDYYMEEQMILRAQKKVAQRLRAKLEQFHAENRITITQRESYYLALMELLHQIHEKARPESQCKVLQRHTPGLTREEFRAKERCPFEYLVKLMRRWLKEEAEKILND